jgi:hypothetical protein
MAPLDESLLVMLTVLAERRLSARIDSIQVSKLLGMAAHDIPILVSAGMLTPLGQPAQNSPKWFSAAEIMSLVVNRDWLDKATRRLSKHWQRNRAQRTAAPKKISITQALLNPVIKPLNQMSPKLSINGSDRALEEQ